MDYITIVRDLLEGLILAARRRRRSAATTTNDETAEFYIMNCFRHDDGAGITSNPSLKPPMDNWFYGQSWSEPVPEPLVFEIHDNDHGRMLSYFPNFPLMTDEMVECIRNSGVDNLATYDAEIREQDTGIVHHNYKAVNVIGLVSAVDESSSDYEDLGIGSAKFYRSLVLDESRANGLLLFRLREIASKIVIHRTIKNNLLDAGIEDLAFIHPNDFSG